MNYSVPETHAGGYMITCESTWLGLISCGFVILNTETKILATAVWTALRLQMKTSAQVSELQPHPLLPQSISVQEESNTDL